MIEADPSKIVDLSVTLSEHLPVTWPEHMPFAHKNWSWFDEEELPTGACTCSLGPYVTHFFILDEHAGTHADAPSHYIPPPDSGLPEAGPLGEVSAEKLDLSKLIGPAAVVDLRHLDGEAEPGASPAITVAHLEAWEQEHGRFEPGEIALLLTGWSKHYVKGEAGRAFLHEPVVLQSRPAWPAPEADAAIFLHERGVNTIGIDAPSMGSAEEGNEVHRAGLSRKMAFVEGLTNLDRLPPRGASFVFLPIKIAVASGAPGRAIALLP
ncbi:MAG TPA: cyclase family protein [Solirubrobacterales bacterium]|nr:cyclase family protein [Solirubrobacterales bacterium]